MNPKTNDVEPIPRPPHHRPLHLSPPSFQGTFVQLASPASPSAHAPKGKIFEWIRNLETCISRAGQRAISKGRRWWSQAAPNFLLLRKPTELGGHTALLTCIRYKPNPSRYLSDGVCSLMPLGWTRSLSDSHSESCQSRSCDERLLNAACHEELYFAFQLR